MRYFLGIMGILGFHDFLIFPSRREYFDTLILYSVFIIVKKIFSSVDVEGMIGGTMLKPSYAFMLISLFLSS